ncbi:hypothetical protein ACOSQ4_032116 [Xanthoceras sorbifolium]
MEQVRKELQSIASTKSFIGYGDGEYVCPYDMTLSIPVVPLLPSPWWTAIGSDRGRSRAAGSFPGQLTGVAWGVRIRCLGDVVVLGPGTVETRVRVACPDLPYGCMCLDRAELELLVAPLVN